MGVGERLELLDVMLVKSGRGRSVLKHDEGVGDVVSGVIGVVRKRMWLDRKKYKK